MSDGRYRAYPKYRASEVEWLSKVPQHWNAPTYIKFISSLKGRLGWQGLKADEYREEGPYVVSSAHFFDESIQWEACPRVSAERYEMDANIQLAEGDILLMKDGAALGKLAFVRSLPGKACLNSHLLLFRPSFAAGDKMYEPRFLFYLFTTSLFQGYLSVTGTGATFLGVSQQAIGQYRLILPPLSEQTQIAKFLDHETTKINRLIEKQEALIRLLREKRQAVISHAVTKGLNPHAPLKDSDIAWLGQVPAHWDVKNYRYSSRIYRGKFGHRPRNDPALYDGKYPFIQTGDIARADKNITAFTQTLNERGIAVSQKFPAGTLVMAIAANIGDTAILGFEAYAPDSVVGFKPCDNVDLEFLRYSLMAALPALEQTSTQSAQANLNIDRIGSVQGAFPPMEEQREIVHKIEALLKNFGVIETEAQTAIKLMQERRTALISAAVTGKIDVRHWKPPASTEQ